MGLVQEILKALGIKKDEKEKKDESIFEELEKTEKEMVEGYKCDICGKEFDSKKGLKIHKSQTHDKRYKCDICGKEFKNEKGLKIHKGMKH
ncbi:MAG: C2H2-type zinc finger protein [Candidatus Aenigmatarchaeota archaeon]